MKKRFAFIIAAIAMMATGAASMGCLWIMIDEPKAMRALCD